MTAKLLNFLENCLEQKGAISVDKLFSLVTGKFPEAQTMFKTQQDLSTFLKMSPDAFHVQSNCVTLIGKPKPFEQKDKHLEVCDQNDKNKKKKTRDEPDRNQNNHSPSPRQVFSPINNEPDSLITHNNFSQPNSLTSHSYPSFELNNSSSPPVSLQQQTLKQRINSLLIKTLAENTERDKTLQNTVIGEALKSKVSQQTKIVVNVKDCVQIVDDIMYPRKSNGKIVVSFDCEGINIGPKGRLTLVQIGTITGQVYVFDLITCPNILQAGGLQKLLESENVIKVSFKIFHGDNNSFQLKI